MVEIKRINTINSEIYSKLEEFFLKSKPYDFCQFSSLTLRARKIREYLDFLKECELTYLATVEGEILGVCVFSVIEERLILVFPYGNSKFKAEELIETMHKIIYQAMEDSGLDKAESPINRKFKKNTFLKWVKKYDKKCKFIGKTKLKIEWSKYDW